MIEDLLACWHWAPSNCYTVVLPKLHTYVCEKIGLWSFKTCLPNYIFVIKDLSWHRPLGLPTTDQVPFVALTFYTSFNKLKNSLPVKISKLWFHWMENVEDFCSLLRVLAALVWKSLQTVVISHIPYPIFFKETKISNIHIQVFLSWAGYCHLLS